MKFKKLLLSLVLASGCTMFAQTEEQRINYKQLKEQPNANFFEIVTQKQNEIKNYDLKKLGDMKEYKHFNRWVDFWKDRVNADGTFPNPNLAFYNAEIITAEGKINNKELRSPLSNQNWVNVGPQNQADINNNSYSNFPQMGRLNAFLRIPHPTTESLDVLFVGAPNGGIWKSVDNGANWTPKTDFLAGIGISDIKMAPDVTFANYTTKPMYVATGDYDGSNVHSIGVLKSTDGGETFQSTGLSFNLTDNQLIGDLLVLTDNIVIAGTNKFIKRTTDGGANWTNVYGDSGDSNNYGFARFAKSGNKIICANIWGGIIKSEDNTNVGATWTEAIAIGTEENKQTTYASQAGLFYVQSQNGQIKQFNFTTNALTNVGTIPAEYNSQGGYNMAMIVEPNFIVNGEFNASHSIDNGANWYRSLNGYWANSTSPGIYVHSDHHRMGFMDVATKKLWSLNDGGLNYIDYGTSPTATAMPTTVYKSGKAVVTQIYNVAINPAGSDGYIISNQDNDHFSKVGSNWYAVAGGDGIQAAINYNSPLIRYSAGQDKKLNKTTTGYNGEYGGNGQEVLIPNVGATGFEFPLEMNKVTPTILYAGGQQGVYKITDNGDTNPMTINYLNSGMPFTKSIATHGATNIYAAKGSEAKFSSDNGVTWVASANIATQAAITSVDFNASNTQMRYMSIGGYSAGNKVFRSMDAGAGWSNISAGLPNIVVKEIILKQNQTQEILFAATELGVYFKVDGNNWAKLGQGLPNVDIRDIDIHYTQDKLVAASFGRGLWEINIANTTLGIDEVSLESNTIKIYPNPSSNVINLEGVKNSEFSYKVINVMGGVVLEGTQNEKMIDISALASNMYILQVFDGEIMKTEKIVKR